MVKYFFSQAGDYLGTFDASALPEEEQAAWFETHSPEGAVEWPEAPADGRDKLINGQIVPYTVPIDPLEVITAAVKSLPVAKRTDAVWGGFIGQCLLAIQNQDWEALAYMVNNFQTQDSDYQTIITQAKQLFGLA